MCQRAWLDCRKCSNWRRTWLLPLPACRTLGATSMQQRKRANAIELALYALCASCFRAPVDLESSATPNFVWYGLKFLDRLAKQTPEHTLQIGICQP
jgi:hypothetical protein